MYACMYVCMYVYIYIYIKDILIHINLYGERGLTRYATKQKHEKKICEKKNANMGSRNRNVLRKIKNKINTLGNLQPGNTFPPTNKVKWDRCTQLTALQLIFSLFSLLVYFLQYKKFMYFLKSSGIHFKRKEGLGGQGGGCRSLGPCAHIHMFHLCLSLIRSIC
jgi:hypothetical protein